jgi:nuclear transport factor 2 (NTF2) superfamily protein
MSWQNAVKNTDGYWKPEESSWDICGCFSDKPSTKSQKPPPLHSTEKEISHHWTQEEDYKLIKLAKKYNKDWETISEKFKNKTSGQLRRRWERKLNPDLLRQDWTSQEDKLLRELVLEYGYDWEPLTAHFKGRSASNLSKRFDSVILLKLTQRELITLQDLVSPRGETFTSMDLGSSLNESNLSALQKRVEDLQGVMKETIDQIEKLENEMCDSNSLLD